MIQQVTKDDLINALADDDAVFLAMLNFPVQRSFPRRCHLTPPATCVLRKLRQDRDLAFDYNDEGMKHCVTRGWVHVDAFDQTGGFEYCFLPSRLHRK
jgi:hypothetical protein